MTAFELLKVGSNVRGSAWYMINNLALVKEDPITVETSGGIRIHDVSMTPRVNGWIRFNQNTSSIDSVMFNEVTNEVPVVVTSGSAGVRTNVDVRFFGGVIEPDYISLNETPNEIVSLLISSNTLHRISLMDDLAFQGMTHRREFESALGNEEVTNPNEVWEKLQNFNDLTNKKPKKSINTAKTYDKIKSFADLIKQ